MKKFNAGTIRKLGSILLLAGITGTFLSVYYFIYLPRQQVQFNSQTFRVLNNIAVNFTERVSNFGVSRRNARITTHFPDVKISRDWFKTDTAKFKILFHTSFNKSINQEDSFFVNRRIIGDSVEYAITNNKKVTRQKGYDTVERKAIKDFLAPLTAIHKKTFPAVYLIQQRLDIDELGRKIFKLDEVLFSTAETEYSIANINTDSLFGDRSLQVPVVISSRIDDIPVRLFLFPFKMQGVSNETYVLAGLMENENYNRHVQNMPVLLLATVIFLIIIVLLSLPFLKIFLLSANESVHLADIRSLIAVIFIIPFFMILAAATLWMYADRDLSVNEQLEYLHTRIKKSFFTEIDRSIRQQVLYDSLSQKPYYFFEDSVFANRQKKSNDLKDDIFYPSIYRHFTNVHWMSPEGRDIAVWNLRNPSATYFDVRDRAYFQEIRRNRGRLLPKSVDSTFVDSSYSIQPILSRLTGEYTISIATKSRARFDTLFPAVLGISSKMYSVYNPILPEGFSFCIIDSSGLVQCHPDTARSLQENIFKESTNNYALRNAVNHKESAFVSDVVLHDQHVKMLVKPLPGLPYYLITYFQERKTNLFVFHVVGFALVSQLILFLMASLLSYFILLSRKKIGKLSFVPHRLNWLKPTANKRNYYLKNILQLLLTFSLVILLSLFHQKDSFDIYFLNVALLLPVFVVIGYYLIKEAKNYADRNGLKSFEKKEEFWGYIRSSSTILLFYVIAAAIYLLLQNHFIFYPQCPGVGSVKLSIGILIIGMPVIATRVAASSFGPSWAPKYLHCFIISLLLAVTMVSIVPSVALLNFGYREEIKLQVQSNQIDLARKIQQRRPVVNMLMWQSKLDTTLDRSFFYRMKFDSNYGIYLTKHDTLATDENYFAGESDLISCSPFFRIVTQFLFLPPEHDDFYNNKSHEDYYKWKASLNQNSNNSISLYYNNISDPRSKVSFHLTTKTGHFYLFTELGKTAAGKLVLVTGILFFFAFYKLIASTTTRIFLLDYFTSPDNEPDVDAEWLSRIYGYYPCQHAMQIIGLEGDKKFSMAGIRMQEISLMQTDDKAEEKILKLQLELQPVFEKIWKSLTPVEQYTLFDFATDGFTNYKKMSVLYSLFSKGLLVTEAESGDGGTGNLVFMSMAFRNYVLGKGTTEEIKVQAKENKSGSWSSLRMVLIVILIAFAVFIFATQQEATQRIITILTSLGTLLPLMLKLFDTSSTGAAAKK
ncbi:hypothetical protein [Pollutibacter soli]|uniref:hypothetical protein n=1 Tax=Pollutibacter soli TaxID=3034157 RepID=UPI0030134F9A